MGSIFSGIGSAAGPVMHPWRPVVRALDHLGRIGNAKCRVDAGRRRGENKAGLAICILQYGHEQMIDDAL